MVLISSWSMSQVGLRNRPLSKKFLTTTLKSRSVDESDKAEKEVLNFLQRQCFQEEISCLKEKGKKNESDGLKGNKEKKSLIKKSRAIFKLDPVKNWWPAGCWRALETSTNPRLHEVPNYPAKETPCCRIDRAPLPSKVGSFRFGTCVIPDSRSSGEKFKVKVNLNVKWVVQTQRNLTFSWKPELNSPLST